MMELFNVPTLKPCNSSLIIFHKDNNMNYTKVFFEESSKLADLCNSKKRVYGFKRAFRF